LPHLVGPDYGLFGGVCEDALGGRTLQITAE